MMDHLLQTRLRRVERRERRAALLLKLGLCWTVVAAVAFVVAQFGLAPGRAASPVFFALLTAALVVALGLVVRDSVRAPDFRAIALRIEAQHPELRGLLLTAVQESADGAKQTFLQGQLMRQALDAALRSDWRDSVPRAWLVSAHTANLVGLVALVLALIGVRAGEGHAKPSIFTRAAQGITVTPGDTELERGNSLVVLARFGGRLPEDVSLVVTESGKPARAIPLVKALADPVFGGSVAEVGANLSYRVEYAGQRTRDFAVKVFEHPRLERADVSLTFPAYTAQPPKRVEDTRRVSAVEGTRLDLALQLNKHVAKATLVARGDPKNIIPLTVAAGQATASLAQFTLAQSKTYELQLVDADGRANKSPVQFVFEALPNRPPEIKIALPRGDVRPSALEEITFDGTVFDDFGSPAYGLGYTLAGQETKFIELGRAVPAKEKRPFNQTLRLEDLGVKPDDLLSWFVWADDVGPDGKARRTNSDLFFAEVRPFDEIYRQGQGQNQSGQQPGNQPQGQGQRTQQLTELQKQIINATWKIQREAKAPLTKQNTDDTVVVRESQKQAIEQAAAAGEGTEDLRAKALWRAAIGEMEKAAEKLTDAAKSPGPLAPALAAEQSAYQTLLKLQAREHSVTRNRNASGGAGGQQANQRQLNQLDLASEENRYETQRQARATQTPQRREQLQVINRLQELARRQQDLNDRLRELQTALQEAKTEQERAEAKRQLKRLQEEQQQMLADVDELRQRMERPENQSQMAQDRQQLDQTRGDVQRAAEAAGQGAASQALAAGTRAQRQLQDMRDRLRKDSSSEFAEDLREMRAEARDIARQQEDIGQKLSTADDSRRRSLSDAGPGKEMLDQLAKQSDRVKKLEERAMQVAQQAEGAEPVLAQQLEDTLRKVAQDDTTNVKQIQQDLLNERLLTRGLNDRLQQLRDREAGGKAIDLTSDLMKEGYGPQAAQAADRARRGTEDLKRGVERAADSVIGDDSESLKLAQEQLDTLTKQLAQEMNRAQPGAANADPNGQSAAGANPGERTPGDRKGVADASAQSGARPGEGQPGEPREGAQPGQGGQPGGQRGAGQRAGERPGSPSPGGLANSGENSPRPDGAQPGAGAARQDSSSAAPPPGPEGNQPADGNGRQRGAGQRGGDRGRVAQDGGGARGGGVDGGAIGGGGINVDNFLNGVAPQRGPIGPLTGADYSAWSDRLREVEQMVDDPQMRNAVATARERARLVRQDYTRSVKKPDWAVVQLQILKPLVEVRSRIADELARREASKESLVPIDKDPVPNRFAESVRRYYEELGKDTK